jgi:hypothetical protein
LPDFHNWLVPIFVQSISDDTRDDVDPAAGGERHNDSDGATGKGFSKRIASSKRQIERR